MGGLKSTWSSVELNLLYCVHLFRLNPDVSLTVKHYNWRRGKSNTKIRLFEGKLWRQMTNFAELSHLIVEEIARVWGQDGGDAKVISVLC